jgi:hypothetical protein
MLRFWVSPYFKDAKIMVFMVCVLMEYLKNCPGFIGRISWPLLSVVAFLIICPKDKKNNYL